jgi:hypothetical protein
MRPSNTVLRRVMRCRRKGQRTAAVVDHIKGDDGFELQALVKHIAELGFDTRLSQAVPSPSMCQSILSDDLAGRQGITPEKFMNATLTEGLFGSLSRTSRTD